MKIYKFSFSFFFDLFLTFSHFKLNFDIIINNIRLDLEHNIYDLVKYKLKREERFSIF